MIHQYFWLFEAWIIQKELKGTKFLGFFHVHNSSTFILKVNFTQHKNLLFTFPEIRHYIAL